MTHLKKEISLLRLNLSHRQHICLLGTGKLGRIVHNYLELSVVLRRHQRKLLSERIKNLGLNHRFLNKARYFDLLITEHFTDYKTSKTKTG